MGRQLGALSAKEREGTAPLSQAGEKASLLIREEREGAKLQPETLGQQEREME